MREFRRFAEAAFHFVETVFEFKQCAIEGGWSQGGCAWWRRQRPREGRSKRCALFGNRCFLMMIGAGDLRQQVGKGGHAVARRFWKISAAKIRRLIGQQKHRQGPAAVTFGQHGVRALINLIEIRALFAVDLDVDEQLVHERGHSGILE